MHFPYILLVCMWVGAIAGFHEMYHQWGKTCNQLSNNVVLQTDRYELVSNAYRNWSLNATVIHDVFRLHPHHRPCQTPQEVAHSVANPVRGYTCSIAWIDGEELCSIMQKYSQFIILGDSLTRHLMNAFSMVLSGDFQYGAFPNIGRNRQPAPYEQCGCDGQFSEAKVCRGYRIDFNFNDMRDIGYCLNSSAAKPIRLFVEEAAFNNILTHKQLCTPEDPRPKFIFLQGGSHFDTSSYYYWTRSLSYQLAAIAEAARNCTGGARFVVVYSGVPANSQQVAAKYPDQCDGCTAWFNYDMGNLLAEHYPSTIFLNFWNLTHEAALAGRTSDGFHQLSDSNLIKIQAVLNVAKLAAKEF